MSELLKKPEQLQLATLSADTKDDASPRIREDVAPERANGKNPAVEAAASHGSARTTKAVDSEKRVLAPMLQQYVDIKRQYSEHLLLFQVGDFYEVFFEDAVQAAEILQIRLTSRDKDQSNPIPMCGVPQHALDNYLPKLLAAGCSCVVVSQVEEANKAKKGGVRREITRIVTPGIRFEGDGLESERFNFLAAVCSGPGGLGAVAYVDISTGHLRLRETESADELCEVLDRVHPSECLIPSMVFDIPVVSDEPWLRPLRSLLQEFGARLVKRPFQRVQRAEIITRLERFLPALHRDGVESLSPFALSALDCLIAYIEEVSFTGRPQLASLEFEGSSGALVIDSATRSNLELVATRLRGEEKHSLLRHIDYSRTAMGARLLSDWILSPSSDEAVIRGRHDAVEELCAEDQRLEEIRRMLLEVRDLDRLCSRVTSGRAAPHDLGVLRDSLAGFPQIAGSLGCFRSAALSQLAADFDLLEDVHAKLATALAVEPPVRLHEGGIFSAGYHPELDRLRSLRHAGKSWLAELEQQERSRSGIPSLKIKYNNVFGYFIEVSKAHLQKIPHDYERKQTLANAERFVTKELKEREVELLSAHSRQVELEKQLFVELREEIAGAAPRLQQSARVLAALDVFCSFSHCARQWNYVRPEISTEQRIEIRRGRHPVVERVLGAHAFVPNDCVLDTQSRRLSVLTGPNMGGKSTFLRQIGLIQLLAQAGSFVPAERASLPIVDRIFTRIGAADDLSRGESTFMVEMRETSVILRKASRSSLVLIDEVGRGTATSDGLAIATAVAEWLLKRIGCMTVFATHFHQLSHLAESEEGAFCLSVGVLEDEQGISFTHRIEESRGDKSFGIEVAKLAGLPDALLARAAGILASLSEERTGQEFLSQKIEVSHTEAAIAPVPTAMRMVIERLKSIRPETITPLQSLQELAELVAQAEKIEQ